MSDDKSKPGGQDRSRIDVSEDYGLRSWSKKLLISFRFRAGTAHGP